MTPLQSLADLDRKLRRIKRALTAFFWFYVAALFGAEWWHD